MKKIIAATLFVGALIGGPVACAGQDESRQPARPTATSVGTPFPDADTQRAERALLRHLRDERLAAEERAAAKREAARQAAAREQAAREQAQRERERFDAEIEEEAERARQVAPAPGNDGHPPGSYCYVGPNGTVCTTY